MSDLEAKFISDPTEEHKDSWMAASEALVTIIPLQQRGNAFLENWPIMRKGSRPVAY